MTAAEPSDTAARWCVLGYAATGGQAETAKGAILALGLDRDGTPSSPGVPIELAPATTQQQTATTPRRPGRHARGRSSAPTIKASPKAMKAPLSSGFQGEQTSTGPAG